MRKISFVILFLLFNFYCSAQWEKGWSVEPSFHIGKILKHSDRLLFDVENPSYGFDVNFTFKKTGKRLWEEKLKYPKTGISLWYFNLGDPKMFGEAIGFAPNISVPLYKSEKLEGRFQVGWGLVYVTKKYDIIENPIGNALGSNVNSLNTFKFQLDYKLARQWKIKTGLSFTHFSNGASQLPNYGLNIPAFMLGAIYTPKPLAPTDFVKLEESTENKKKWGVSAYLALAYKELNPANGPRYPFYIVSLALTSQKNSFSQLSYGVNYEYSTSQYRIGLDSYTFNSESEARRKSTRLGVFIAHEFFLNNVGVFTQAGTYIPGFNYGVKNPIFTKLGIRYHLPKVGKPATRFYFGVYLKSHAITAEYLSLGIGARL